MKNKECGTDCLIRILYFNPSVPIGARKGSLLAAKWP